HAEEVATGNPTFLTIASTNKKLAQELQIILQNHYLQVNTTADVLGVEWSSVLKNIYAILVGIAHGQGYKDNFTSILVSACLREMSSVLQFVCPEQRNILENVYLGDLLVTAYSVHSRNRRLGFLVGSGYSVMEAFDLMQMVAEGYYAVETAHKLVHEQIEQFPLLDMVQKILYQNNSPTLEMKKLIENHLC
ncbi:MAG: glycerol-3-phosphate dehydrogenase, partial [Bacteroidia bacterium]|nr:glycerol-3-phosphate dehydrogenase [Bacteroidia bacterium]